MGSLPGEYRSMGLNPIKQQQRSSNMKMFQVRPVGSGAQGELPPIRHDTAQNSSGTMDGGA